jgi:hypothetical protein
MSMASLGDSIIVRLQSYDPIFTKLHRKVEPHLKMCILVLEFSKWPPIQKLKNSFKFKNEKISMEMDIYRK